MFTIYMKKKLETAKNLRLRVYVLSKSSEDPIVISQQSPCFQTECCKKKKKQR